MGETADLSLRSAFYGVLGGPASRVRDVATVPPGRSGTSILTECYDGDNAPWNGQPGQIDAECCLVSDGYVFPYNSPRWIRFGLSFEAVATYTSNNWHFICESHFATGGTSAPFAINLQTVNGSPTFQFVYTPIGWTRLYPEQTRRSITYGDWTEVCIGILPHTSNGWIEIWYDGVKVWEVRGVRTFALAEAAYMVIGPYRPIGVSGRTAGIFHDMRVFDALPTLGAYDQTPVPLQYHNGGRIKFGPDDKLYVCVGDATGDDQLGATNAQDLTSLNGKILRLNPDGTAPADNPFFANPNATAKKVYSYGHRNPQGLAWNPTNGDLWATELGPTSEVGPDANDEINRIVSGGNYGWPYIFGNGLDNPNYTTPGGFTSISPVANSGPTVWEPAGATFYEGSVLPSSWKDCLIFTGLGIEGKNSAGVLDGRAIYRLPLSGVDERTPGLLEKLFENQFGRIRDIIEGPDGYLYFCTSNLDGRGPGTGINATDDRIVRVIPGYAQQVLTSGTVEGSHHARFEVRQPDVVDVVGQVKSHVSLSDQFVEGQERTYEWFTKLDPTFPDGSAGQWNVLTWFDSNYTGSPLMGLYFEAGIWQLMVNPATGVSGAAMAGQTFKQVWTAAATGPLDQDAWVKFRLRVRWSVDPAIGYVELMVNDVKQTMNGVNGNGTQRHTDRTLVPVGIGASTFARLRQGIWASAIASTKITRHDGTKIGNGVVTAAGSVARVGASQFDSITLTDPDERALRLRVRQIGATSVGTRYSFILLSPEHGLTTDPQLGQNWVRFRMSGTQLVIDRRVGGGNAQQMLSQSIIPLGSVFNLWIGLTATQVRAAINGGMANLGSGAGAAVSHGLSGPLSVYYGAVSDAASTAEKLHVLRSQLMQSTPGAPSNLAVVVQPSDIKYSVDPAPEEDMVVIYHFDVVQGGTSYDISGVNPASTLGPRPPRGTYEVRATVENDSPFS